MDNLRVAPVTDLEMTKLCAEAMGFELEGVRPAPYEGPGVDIRFGPADGPRRVEWYDPLNEDRHAMALVKKFGLLIEGNRAYEPSEWTVQQWNNGKIRWDSTTNSDLNRAIVECVAKLQAAK